VHSCQQKADLLVIVIVLLIVVMAVARVAMAVVLVARIIHSRLIGILRVPLICF